MFMFNLVQALHVVILQRPNIDLVFEVDQYMTECLLEMIHFDFYSVMYVHLICGYV